MAVPVQPGTETGQAFLFAGQGVAVIAGSLCLLVDLPQADGAVGDMGAQARAGPDCGVRAGNVVLVADAAAIQERREKFIASCTAANLAVRTLVRHCEVLNRVASGKGLKGVRFRDCSRSLQHRLPHQLCPGSVPDIPVAQAANHTELVPLPEFHMVFRAPANDRPVTLIGPLSAGFLMAEDAVDAVMSPKLLQRIDHRPSHYQKLAAGVSKLSVQIVQ